MMRKADVLALATDDYQNRNGNYPKSDVADSIKVHIRMDDTYELTADFKNTTEDSAKQWLSKFIKRNGLELVNEIQTMQDGDYQNDWVVAYANVKIV